MSRAYRTHLLPGGGAEPDPAGRYRRPCAGCGSHGIWLLVLVRQNGTTTWVQQRPPQGDARTQEYALCRMLYTMLCGVTGIRPPWGMMTGVRPVRIIHDLRAESKPKKKSNSAFAAF